MHVVMPACVGVGVGVGVVGIGVRACVLVGYLRAGVRVPYAWNSLH